ncbi:helix-turn-helix domain-containing protein, partial [Streptomyces graminilatus]|uniref:helix-turn-helix domain-containing protein n=1 Tax=Streptomyces graminilatus TaxID=1464070 RepID=UPI0012FF11EB
MSTHDDVAEFAALLTGLKGRTDRSYGSLARRLGMNTSTLHRYCSGDTVPLDFAPVERFAALCGASPEERVELHRLWILAVAARQRPRTPGVPGTSGEPGTTGQPDTSTDSDPPTAAPAFAEPRTVTEARTPYTEAAPAESAAPEAAAPDVTAATGRPPAQVPAGLPWYRHRRVVVATAVVGTFLAVLGTLGGLSALSDDRTPPKSSQAPS